MPRLPHRLWSLSLAILAATAAAGEAPAPAQPSLSGDADPRAAVLDRFADEMQVRLQELWNDAQVRKIAGIEAMQRGEYAEAERLLTMARIRLENLPLSDERVPPALRELEALEREVRARREERERAEAVQRNRLASERSRQLREAALRLERERIDAMLRRALRARERRDYDEAILLCEQVLKINRADQRAVDLLAKCRRERHVYIRQLTADRWDEEHKLLSESIRTAMLPQLELVRYSTEWPEIDARRTAPTQSVEEQSEAWRKELANLLEQEITLDFQDTDIAEVVSFLQRVTSANIVLDPRVAAQGATVTLKVERMKLRFVLDFIMKITGLRYAMRNEAIYISNEQGTRGDLFMKIYDIRDLTHALSSFPGPSLEIPEPGSTGSRLLPPIEPEQRPETSEFIEIIRQVVAPSSWGGEQGGASIEEYNGAMVVTQSAEVHAQIDELLRALRTQRGAQIHVKCKFLNVENSMLEEIGVSWQNYNGAFGRPLNAPYNANTQIGAAWGELRPDQMLGAARINNQLLDYTSNSTLQRAANLPEGLTLQTQTWQIANQFWASAILTAVEKERRGNIVFEPDVTLFNGQQAHIVNMNQQSYISDYDVQQQQYDPIISILSYGTVLDVQAIASADKKYITLTLRPTNAQVRSWRRFGSAVGSFPGGPVEQGGVAIADTLPMLIPQLIYSAVRTTVTIPDGGSLVIAGMTNGESRRSHAGVPFLSHIPFLGRLFSASGRAETERRELIVVQADLLLFDEIESKL